MPLHTALWKVGATPEPIEDSALLSEQTLEEMIVRAPSLLSDAWMLIGRQVETGFGGKIDLLAIAKDGSLVIIELKRDKTPRDVVAQALDYASWVSDIKLVDVERIYGKFKSGKSIGADFQITFGVPLEEDEFNQSHQIVIVASSLDDSSERIIRYLNKRNIPIDTLFFQVFKFGTEQLISRTRSLDNTGTTAAGPSAAATVEPWNGEFYCSFGQGPDRSWDDATEYGFICGGGDPWYSRTLSLLNPGDRVWVKIPNWGFVGVGIVTATRKPASEFYVETPAGSRNILEVAKRASYHSEAVNDLERCEYFVSIRWLQTVPTSGAVYEAGLFGNQNTVCRPTTYKWRTTITRLKQLFKNWQDEDMPVEPSE